MVIHIPFWWWFRGNIGTVVRVDTTSQGKNLPLTRYAIEKATQQERLLYGRVVAELIEQSGLQQKEIAEASNVTARTIRNIVKGETAPQADKLIALLITLGVDLDGEAEREVRPYTQMLAPVIRRIHPDYRDAAVSEAIGGLSDAALAHPNLDRLAPVTPLRVRGHADHELQEGGEAPRSAPKAAKPGRRKSEAAPTAD